MMMRMALAKLSQLNISVINLSWVLKPPPRLSKFITTEALFRTSSLRYHRVPKVLIRGQPWFGYFQKRVPIMKIQLLGTRIGRTFSFQCRGGPWSEKRLLMQFSTSSHPDVFSPASQTLVCNYSIKRRTIRLGGARAWPDRFLEPRNGRLSTGVRASTT